MYLGAVCLERWGTGLDKKDWQKHATVGNSAMIGCSGGGGSCAIPAHVAVFVAALFGVSGLRSFRVASPTLGAGGQRSELGVEGLGFTAV